MSDVEIIRLLVIEDNLTVTAAVRALLKASGAWKFEPVFCKSLHDGLSELKSRSFEVVLLDLGLPDSEGFDTLANVRKAEPDLPVVVLTGAEDERLAMQAIQAGAQDYLEKEHVMRGPLLVRSLFYAVERHRLERKMTYFATHDELTGAFCRRVFMERLHNAVSLAKRYHDTVTLCLCDIDDFKSVNDNYGHVNGDLALVAFSKKIQDNLRETDLMGRFGGDEFCMLFPHTSAEDAMTFIDRVTAEGVFFSSHDTAEEVKINSSFGLAQFDNSMKSIDEFIDAADQALYQAKKAGKNKAVIFKNTTCESAVGANI